MAKERNLEFVQNIADDILVTTNKEWMDSIFSNLLTNSIKYASTSKIHILLQKDLQHVIFIISNESNNQTLDLNKIWNPYYVGEKSRNKHLSGTGLGLSMVKKMTEKLNYEISCTFENLFITFTLRIPF